VDRKLIEFCFNWKPQGFD